ncbi:unnamed protein product [Kluyveromyces dobzhanskii CBS 2104]|uniref:WGS project CCBQ000000000 data, contig 00102 n=1 Tax=Kluyveromyces dobzhanskii CBS 2104 TaxID=1427455 RepID=A0A0A8L6D5_9SACH|nr:unnamed protein product [Kluyveromyces dobzhanskii CBS 2104]
MADDTTSFESIIANVRKRRAEYDLPQIQPQHSQQQQHEHEKQQGIPKQRVAPPQEKSAPMSGPVHQQKSSNSLPKPSGPVVNSFNQQHDNSSGNSQVIYNQKKKAQQSNLVDNSNSTKTLFVSSSQTGNPLLKSLVNVNWRYVKSTPTAPVYYDYQIKGRNVLFLSLKYHKLHPEYIGKKLQAFKRSEGNILLCVVDIEDSEDILRELNKTCMFQGFAILLAFTFEQAGKYLSFMNK